MHSDKDGLAQGVPIASLSVGAVREFVVRRKRAPKDNTNSNKKKAKLA